jgi:hypothetical protein
MKCIHKRRNNVFRVDRNNGILELFGDGKDLLTILFVKRFRNGTFFKLAAFIEVHENLPAGLGL